MIPCNLAKWIWRSSASDRLKKKCTWYIKKFLVDQRETTASIGRAVRRNICGREILVSLWIYSLKWMRAPTDLDYLSTSWWFQKLKALNMNLKMTERYLQGSPLRKTIWNRTIFHGDVRSLRLYGEVDKILKVNDFAGCIGDISRPECYLSRVASRIGCRSGPVQLLHNRRLSY